MKYADLATPFEPENIEWRVQRFGGGAKPWCIVVPYVTNRAIMERLDAVVGPQNWKNEYQRWGERGVLCGLSIWSEARLEWVTKWDGADETDIEATKGGLSSAMKRAAVQWGMGRHLYTLTETMFAPTGSFEVKPGKGGKEFCNITDPDAISARYLGGKSKRKSKPKPKKAKEPIRAFEDWSELIAGATTMDELTAIGKQLGEEADVLDLTELRGLWKARREEIKLPAANDTFTEDDDGESF